MCLTDAREPTLEDVYQPRWSDQIAARLDRHAPLDEEDAAVLGPAELPQEIEEYIDVLAAEDADLRPSAANAALMWECAWTELPLQARLILASPARRDAARARYLRGLGLGAVANSATRGEAPARDSAGVVF